MSSFRLLESQLCEIDSQGQVIRVLGAVESYELLKGGLFREIRIQEEFEEIQLVVKQTTNGLLLEAHVCGNTNKFPVSSLENSPTYLIVNETWIPISQGGISEALELLHEVQIKDLGKISIHQALFLYIHGRKLRPAVKHDWDYLAVTSPGALTPLPLMSVTPYEYQKIGFEWLAWLKSAGVGGLLGDEMGLGKTLQVIMLLQQEIQSGNYPNLVVCPPSLLENWRREISRFIGIDGYVHQGSNRRFDRQNFLDQKVVIVSYDALRRDYLYLKQVEWNVIAVDEAQYIKNSDSQRTASLMQLSKRMGVAVTGTPIENSLDDLWSLMNFSCEGLLGSKEWFKATFEGSSEGLKDLQRTIKPLILRRRVSEVAKDLPAINIQDIPFGFPAEILEEYLSIDTSTSTSYADAFKRISKQRKVANHLSEDSNIDYFSSHVGKLEYLQNSLIELLHNDLKAIIFAPYTRTINELINWSSTRFPNSFVESIYGATPIQDRQIIIDKFTSHNGFGVLIMNPKAGGVGLNITTANHVFHFSPDWNPAVIDQANARVYRRGQTKPVTVHNLFYVDSIEEYMIERLQMKRELAETALENTSTTPTLDELNEALRRRPRMIS